MVHIVRKGYRKGWNYGLEYHCLIDIKNAGHNLIVSIHIRKWVEIGEIALIPHLNLDIEFLSEILDYNLDFINIVE